MEKKGDPAAAKTARDTQNAALEKRRSEYHSSIWDMVTKDAEKSLGTKPYLVKTYS